MAANTTPNINSLPNEILVKIFNHLPESDIFYNILDVDEHWRQIVVDHIPWSKVVVNIMAPIPNCDWAAIESSTSMLEKTVTLGVKIECLVLKNCRNAECLDPILKMICDNNVPIHTLVLDSIHINGEIRLLEIIDKCPLLKTLILEEGTFVSTLKRNKFDYPTVYDGTPRLETLKFKTTFDSEKGFGLDFLENLLVGSPNLKHFEMADSNSYQTLTLDFFRLLSSLKNLETLSLDSVNWESTDILQPLQSNSKLKNLTVLGVKSSVITDHFDYKPLATLHSLNSVTFSVPFCSVLKVREFFASLPISIEHLRVYGVECKVPMDDSHLKLLMEKTNLKKLTIQVKQLFSDGGMQKCISKLVNLEYLSFTFFPSAYLDILFYSKDTWIKELLRHPKMKLADLFWVENKDVVRRYTDLFQQCEHIHFAILEPMFPKNWNVRIEWKRNSSE